MNETPATGSMVSVRHRADWARPAAAWPPRVPAWESASEAERERWDHEMAIYAAQIERMDAVIHEGKWNLLLDEDGSGLELYDLNGDAGETTDLPERRPVLTEPLRDGLLAWGSILSLHPPADQATRP